MNVGQIKFKSYKSSVLNSFFFDFRHKKKLSGCSAKHVLYIDIGLVRKEMCTIQWFVKISVFLRMMRKLLLKCSCGYLLIYILNLKDFLFCLFTFILYSFKMILKWTQIIKICPFYCAQCTINKERGKVWHSL